MISVPFELEQVEFGKLIPGIPLPEKSQNLSLLSKRHFCISNMFQNKVSVNSCHCRLSFPLTYSNQCKTYLLSLIQ